VFATPSECRRGSELEGETASELASDVAPKRGQMRGGSRVTWHLKRGPTRGSEGKTNSPARDVAPQEDEGDASWRTGSFSCDVRG